MKIRHLLNKTILLSDIAYLVSQSDTYIYLKTIATV